MNVDELVVDVMSRDVKPINVNTTPQYNEVHITLHMLKDNLRFNDKSSMITLFVRSAINLKTEINRTIEKQRCIALGDIFYAKSVPVGKLDHRQFALMGALKMYLDKMSDIFGTEMSDYVNDYLAKNKDGLIFTGLNVKFDTTAEADHLNRIIDTLCVKFYDHVIYAITIFLSIKGRAFIMTLDKDGYVFKFRPFNIMERSAVAQGKIPFNLRE